MVNRITAGHGSQYKTMGFKSKFISPWTIEDICFISPSEARGTEVFKKHVRHPDNHVGPKCEIRFHRGLSTVRICLSVRLSVTDQTSPNPMNHSG